MAATPASRVQTAIRRATAEGLYRQVERASSSSWTVPGTECLFYLVRRHGWAFVCDCRAGSIGQPCRHAAAAFVTVIRDQAGKGN